MLPSEPAPVAAAAHDHVRLLEVSHVARRLRTGLPFVRRLIRDHELPAIRLGTQWRVDERDLQVFLDARRTRGPRCSVTSVARPLDDDAR